MYSCFKDMLKSCSLFSISVSIETAAWYLSVLHYQSFSLCYVFFERHGLIQEAVLHSWGNSQRIPSGTYITPPWIHAWSNLVKRNLGEHTCLVCLLSFIPVGFHQMPSAFIELRWWLLPTNEGTLTWLWESNPQPSDRKSQKMCWPFGCKSQGHIGYTLQNTCLRYCWDHYNDYYLGYVYITGHKWEGQQLWDMWERVGRLHWSLWLHWPWTSMFPHRVLQGHHTDSADDLQGEVFCFGLLYLQDKCSKLWLNWSHILL